MGAMTLIPFCYLKNRIILHLYFTLNMSFFQLEFAKSVKYFTWGNKFNV